MATKQATENRKRRPSPVNGQILPDGFEKYPERRHNGAWKKEDTARYKLEQMMKLSEEELIKIIKDKDAPYFERKLATCINKGDWAELSGMMNQVYGLPKQINENRNIELKPILPMKEKK